MPVSDYMNIMFHFRYIIYLTFIFALILETSSSSLYNSLKELEDLGNPNSKFNDIEEKDPGMGRNRDQRCCQKKSDCKLYERCGSCNVCVKFWDVYTCRNTRARSLEGHTRYGQFIPRRCQSDWECDLGEKCIGGFCQHVCFPPQPWPVPVGKK